jgi:hypothetical protein
MSVLPTPIRVMLRMSIFLRPIRSPKWPNTMPPSGRAKYPVASVPKLATVPTSGSRFEKKILLNTIAEAVA